MEHPTLFVTLLTNSTSQPTHGIPQSTITNLTQIAPDADSTVRLESDQVCDVYNRVHACEMASRADKDIGIRCASGFNELFEAALRKETEYKGESGSRDGQSGSGLAEKGKEKQKDGVEVQKLKQLMKVMIKEAYEMAAMKWTWGVNLTVDDLDDLIQGADHQCQVPHSGYDESLPTSQLRSQTSEALDPQQLEDPMTPICELALNEIPNYSVLFLGLSGNENADSEPDPAIEVFTKWAKVKLAKANKSLMQEEVDQPVSFLDYGSEFLPQTALIPVGE